MWGEGKLVCCTLSSGRLMWFSFILFSFICCYFIQFTTPLELFEETFHSGTCFTVDRSNWQALSYRTNEFTALGTWNHNLVFCRWKMYFLEFWGWPPDHVLKCPCIVYIFFHSRVWIVVIFGSYSSAGTRLDDSFCCASFSQLFWQ